MRLFLDRFERFCSVFGQISLICGWLACSLTSRAEPLAPVLARARADYASCRSNYLATARETDGALKMARVAFALADLSPSDEECAAAAALGVEAAQLVCQKEPRNAAAQYYLGLNLGALARTKKLEALSLLRRMETALTAASEVDAHFDHAGPDRSLGLLYLEAPGWPISVGSKRKARDCLEKAVALDPAFPDNRLTVLEAYSRWGESGLLRTGMKEYESRLAVARQSYAGPEWEQAWHDWDARWQALREKAGKN